MSQKPTCIICGEVRGKSQFTAHRNDKLNENFGICKKCTNNVNVNDIDEVLDMLRLLNIPYDKELFDEIVSQEKKDKVIPNYLRAISVKKEYTNFKDSMFIDTVNSDEYEEVEEKLNNVEDFKVTSKVIGRWGAGKSKEEYMSLEYAYKMLADTKPPSTVLEETRYVQNVKLKFNYDQALDDGVAKDIKIAKEAYTKDLKELGLDTISNDGEKLIGVRIKEWELHSPVPEPDDELKDVDGVMDYITKFFLIPMKRVFNFATQEEIEKLDETTNNV